MMTAKERRKLLRYVERDRVTKLSKLLDKSEALVDCPLNEQGQTALHLAAKLGYPEAVGVLLKHGADAAVRDVRLCFPLHYAAKLCLKKYSNEHYYDLVQPLVRASQGIMHEANRKGTTSHVLVKALEERKRLETAKNDPDMLSDTTSSSSTNEDEWLEKLDAEGQADIAQAFGRYDQLISEDRWYPGESYDQWADRIFSEYQRKHHVRKEVKKPQVRETTEAPSKKKLKLRPMKEPSQRDLGKVYLDFQRWVNESSTEVIQAKDLPFCSNTSSSYIMSVIFGCLESKSDVAESKKFIRDCIRFWHPDKFLQRFGHRFAEGQTDQIMEIVKHVTQALISTANS